MPGQKAKLFFSMAAINKGSLVSRAQARRIALQRDFDGYDEVELDFAGVDGIGEAFVDELLRGWPLAHPQTKVIVVNVGEVVQRIIDHAGLACNVFGRR